MRPPKPSWRHPEPLFLKMTLAVLVLLVCTLTPLAYYAANEYFESALEIRRREARAIGELIRMTVEQEMLEEDLDRVGKMIHGYSSALSGRRVMILDRLGRVRFTNDPSFADVQLDPDSPTCQVCHSRPPEERAESAVVELEAGEIIRSVHPLKNRVECHRCHDPEPSINGVVITDTDVAALRAGLRADMRVIALVIVFVTLVLITGIGFLVRRLILRPLARLETMTRSIGAGDFSKRVEAEGTDAVARLGTAFNAMADSVTDLLAELRQQRQKLENVMNSVDDGLLVVDETFTVIGVNSSLVRRMDATREDILYRRCRTIWGADSDCSRNAEDGACPAKSCFETGKVCKALRVRHTSDGDRREEEVFASPIFGANGEVEQVVEVWRDITERKSQEARMAEFHRLASLGMLASGFSHEINTPLGTVLLRADDIRIQAGAADGELEGIEKKAELIRSDILRCRAITQQFLRLSRGQSLGQDLLEIPAIVRATVPLAAHTASEAGVTLEVVESASTPVVMANVGAVQQVLLNLMLNAVQACEPGGEVRVGWSTGSEAVIRIEDNGVGMSPEVRSKVFEPFYSARPSGTGLGLFVSLNLARHWGGDIRVKSEPSIGSLFEVTFAPPPRSWATTDS